MIRREAVVGAIVNSLVAVIVVWALYRGRAPVPVLGTDGGAFGIIPGTFMLTLLMTIGLTMAVRGRVKAGAVSRIERWQAGVGARLPANVVLRAVTLAGSAWVCCVPVTLALLATAGPAAWSFAAVMAFNVVYFALLSLLVVPVMVRRALADPA